MPREDKTLKKNVSKKERITTKWCLVANSNRANHYIMTNNDVPSGEVSGDTINVLEISACDILSRESFLKRGLDSLEIKARYKAFIENLRSLRQQGEIKEAEKLREDYIRDCRKVSINFGLEKALCIREYMTLSLRGVISDITFGKNTLERIKNYKLQSL